MRILQLSTFDGRFGAAIAARRLHEALLAKGQESDFLVNEVTGDSPRTHGPRSGLEKLDAKVRHAIDQFPLRFYSQQKYSLFSPNWVPSTVARRVESFQSDIVHLHWCQSDFVSTPILPHLGRPLFWTFHDMWAFTGGCHYTAGCERYLGECGQCPVLQSTREHDLSRWLWWQKKDVYHRLRSSLQIICPSNWLAGLARHAPLLEGIPVHVVPNPIDTETFKPIDKTAARRLLGLPEEGRLLLWGATSREDSRKGFDLLEEAVHLYDAQPNSLPLGVVITGMQSQSKLVEAAKLKVLNLRFLQDEVSLAALYNAVDVVALPSRQENLSNALAEALCCGTPCVAFQIGGNSDLISHLTNGFLAKPDDARDMAIGLDWVLNNLKDVQRAAISKAAHEQLSSDTLIPRFLSLYQSASNK